MLVDFAVEEMARRAASQALVEAGRRARPIVMTTIAMVAGMFSALAYGDGGESARRWRLR